MLGWHCKICRQRGDRRRKKRKYGIPIKHVFKACGWGTGRPGEKESEGPKLCIVFSKRSTVFVGKKVFCEGYAPRLKDYVDEENIFRDRPVLLIHFQRVFAFDMYGTIRRIWNSFVFIASDGKDGSVLWAAWVLPLFCLTSQTDSGGIEYVFLQYVECTPSLNEVGKELACVCQSWSTTDKVYHDAVREKELNNWTKLNMGEWFRVEPFSAICGIVHIVPGNYGIQPLNKPLRWPYHGLIIKRFYGDDLLQMGGA